MEQQLFYQINQQWIGAVADWVMATASSLDFWMVPLVIVLTCILIFGGFRGRALVVVLALTIFVTDGIVVKTMKETVNRLRPSQYPGTRVVKLQKTTPRVLGVFKAPQVQMTKPKKKKETRGVSFPSGHTANNFAAAAVLLMFFRRRGWLYLPMAALVSYSRMYTGSHWPGDVIFSVFLGLGLGWAMVRLCEWLWKRFGPRVIPGLYQRHPTLLGNKVVPSTPDYSPAA